MGILSPMVRPDRTAERERGGTCCIGLAGMSPAVVSAGAPRSRPRVTGETSSSEWGVESPPGAVRLLGGGQVHGPSDERTLQPRDIGARKGRAGRAAHVTAKATDCIQNRSDAGRPRGMEEGTWTTSPMRNRRDPTRRPTLGEGGPYKPRVKGDRAGRESEGSIVPGTPVEKAGRGKGPCFGRDGVRR